MSSPIVITTTEMGRKYAKRLIGDTITEHFGDAHPTEQESDLLNLVVHDLTEPYHKALHVERDANHPRRPWPDPNYSSDCIIRHRESGGSAS